MWPGTARPHATRNVASYRHRSSTARVDSTPRRQAYSHTVTSITGSYRAGQAADPRGAGGTSRAASSRVISRSTVPITTRTAWPSGTQSSMLGGKSISASRSTGLNWRAINQFCQQQHLKSGKPKYATDPLAHLSTHNLRERGRLPLHRGLAGRA